MIRETKQELIEKYNKGELKDLASHGTSYYTGYVLIEWDDEQVFGYEHTQLSDEIKKDFFKVKINHTNEDMTFRVKGTILKGSDFLRHR